MSDIWVALEAKTAEAISSSSKLTLSVKAEGVQITAAVGTNGKDATTVVVSKGTVYAYMLAKPDWDGNPKKEKAKIKSLKLDQWGL